MREEIATLTKVPLRISYSSRDVNFNREPYIFRKFINSAIYVEKEIPKMGPFRSPKLNRQYSTQNFKIIKTKRCSCYIDRMSCPCHMNDQPYDQESGSSSPSSSSNSSNTMLTVKPKITADDLKLSLHSLSTHRQSEENNTIRDWLAKKNEEKKRKERQEEEMRLQNEKERQELIEKERENFKRWLENKRKEEEKKKLDKQKDLELEKLKEREREGRRIENELRFKLWLKQKEEEMLEKKIQAEQSRMRAEEERQKRTMESREAFELWLKNSRMKQKPIALNQGLDTLRSSVSVTYINPIPWKPNIETPVNPKSQ